MYNPASDLSQAQQTPILTRILRCAGPNGIFYFPSQPPHSPTHILSPVCRMVFGWQLIALKSQRAHDLWMTLDWRQCDVTTSHWRQYDVISTLCVCRVLSAADSIAINYWFMVQCLIFAILYMYTVFLCAWRLLKRNGLQLLLGLQSSKKSGYLVVVVVVAIIIVGIKWCFLSKYLKSVYLLYTLPLLCP